MVSFLGNVVFLSFYLPFLSARLKCIIRTSPYVRSPHPSLPRDGKMLWTPALEEYVDVQTLIILAIERVLLSASGPDDRKFIRADVL